jgi:hypothetical protein
MKSSGWSLTLAAIEKRTFARAHGNVRDAPIVLKNSTMGANGCGGTERLSG